MAAENKEMRGGSGGRWPSKGQPASAALAILEEASGTIGGRSRLCVDLATTDESVSAAGRLARHSTIEQTG